MLIYTAYMSFAPPHPVPNPPPHPPALWVQIQYFHIAGWDVSIAGLACPLPTHWLTNTDLEDKWQPTFFFFNFFFF